MTHLIDGGSSLITKNTGHIDILDDLKTSAPSVFIPKEMLFGLKRKPLSIRVWYFWPSKISANSGVNAKKYNFRLSKLKGILVSEGKEKGKWEVRLWQKLIN